MNSPTSSVFTSFVAIDRSDVAPAELNISSTGPKKYTVLDGAIAYTKLAAILLMQAITPMMLSSMSHLLLNKYIVMKEPVQKNYDLKYSTFNPRI